MGVLERVWMVDVDVCVVIVYDNDTSAKILHISRGVTWVSLLLMLSLSLLLQLLLVSLLVFDIVLIKRLFGHAYLVRADSTVLSTLCSPGG